MKNRIKSLTLIFTTLLVILPQILFSQKAPIKFGDVSKEELAMTVYEKDTTAEAVILASYGTSEISYIQDKGFVLVYKNHTRIKILKKAGLDFANVEVKLHVARENVEEDFGAFKAQTYNLENGKIVESKLSRKEVFEEDASKYSKLKKFALPNVKVGSVIEYQYQITSEFFYIRPWYFQTTIPVIWSEYRTIIPEYYEFKHFLDNYHTPFISEESTATSSLPGTTYSYIINKRRLVHKDLEAFKTEDYITTPKDYLAKVEFEHALTKLPNQGIQTHTTSWKEICFNLMSRDDFGGALNRHGIVKEITDMIDLNASKIEKVNMAYFALKQKMKWDDYYGIYVEKTLRNAYNEGSGSVAEINLLLVNLLRSIDISSYPVVLSTRTNGMVNKYFPKQGSFNYVIAAAIIDGKTILLDASRDFLEPGSLAINCLNGEGMMVTDNEPVWVELKSNETFNYSANINVTLTEEEGLSATFDERTTNLSARDLRIDIAKDTKEKYIQNIIEKTSEWEISSYEIENETDLSKPLVEKYTVDEFSNIDSESDIIYLPAILGEDGTNPFTDEKRDYPVDFGAPISNRYIININLPENYKVDAVPENAGVILPEKAAEFIYKTQQVGNILQIYCQTKINKTFFLPEEYALLKSFYSHINEKLNEQIVIKKI